MFEFSLACKLSRAASAANVTLGQDKSLPFGIN